MAEPEVPPRAACTCSWYKAPGCPDADCRARVHHMDGQREPVPDQPARVRDPWPRELWWCENDECNEPTCEDPCQFCGMSVVRYKVVPADWLTPDEFRDRTET